MRDEPEPGPEDGGPEEQETPPERALKPTPPSHVAGWAVVGLVVGWAVHPVSERLGAVPPLVSWTQPLALLLMAAILAATAVATWQTVHVRHERLLPHQAVNRLVLARACALVAALVGGGYLGYGLSWLGDPAELPDDRMWRSFAAAIAAALGIVAALVLERACRVRDDDPEA